MSSASNTGFQFITSINTVNRDEETRRKVRSHARRQKLPTGPSQPPQAKRSGSQKDHTSKFRLKPAASSSSGNGRQEKKLKKTNWLAVTVARELPNFSLLGIEKTPFTENLLKYCMAVCLSPQENAVEKWFNRTGAPTYLNVCKLVLLLPFVSICKVLIKGRLLWFSCQCFRNESGRDLDSSCELSSPHLCFSDINTAHSSNSTKRPHMLSSP